MRHGWFAIEGYQTGDRTLAEQITGCEFALVECAGKTVLDLGTAEGLIAYEFAKAGARIVRGVDHSSAKIETASKLNQWTNVNFVCHDIGRLDFPPLEYDIVLALSIITKFPDPALVLRKAADTCKDLLLLRNASVPNPMYYAKHGGKECNAVDVLTERGFKAERHCPGTHDEGVWYWRRVTQ